MKKMMSFALALVMVLAMSVTAFATQSVIDGTVPGSATGTIDATYTNGGEETVSKYYVTIDWEQSGTLEYKTNKTTYTWNPETTSYNKTGGETGWTVTDAQLKITVTNKSDNKVKASFGDVVSKVDGLTIAGNYDKNQEVEIESAAGATKAAAGSPKTADNIYKITSVTGAIDEGKTIASITVSVSGIND